MLETPLPGCFSLLAEAAEAFCRKVAERENAKKTSTPALHPLSPVLVQVRAPCLPDPTPGRRCHPVFPLENPQARAKGANSTVNFTHTRRP